MRQCSLCDRTEKTHVIGVESEICNVCDAVLRYWSDKTPRQLMQRSRQIDSFQARMDVLLGNVKRIKPKRRKAA